MTADKKAGFVKAILIGIAIGYAFVLLHLVLFKTGLSFDLRQLQLIPFLFIRDIIVADAAPDILFINDMGNVAIFIPLGILLPLFFSKLSVKKTVFCVFLVSLGFEITQFITGLGMSDVDDLILNTLGGALGAWLYYGVFYRRRQCRRAALWSLLFLIVFGCCGLAFLWFYSPGSLPTQIEYVNEEALGSTDRESFDLSGVCIDMTEGQLRVKNVALNDGSASQVADEIISYSLGENAIFLLEQRSFQYSPNGNIQKTTVTYKTIDREQLNAVIQKSEGSFCDLWLNENGEVVMAVIISF